MSNDVPETLILITIQDDGGYWYPRAVTPKWIAESIEHAHYGGVDVEPYKLWDIDADGTPHPAEICWGLAVTNDNDYTHRHGEIVNSASGEKVADIFVTIDDRA